MATRDYAAYQDATEDDSKIVFSDEEGDDDADIPTWDVAKDYELPFGKYKGRTMNYLLGTRQRRSYLAYILKWDQLRTIPKNAILCALAHYDALKEARTTRRDRSKSPARRRAD